MYEERDKVLPSAQTQPGIQSEASMMRRERLGGEERVVEGSEKVKEDDEKIGKD